MSPLVTSALLLAGLGVFANTMMGRLRSMARLKAVPGNRMDRVGERLFGVLKFGLGQRRMVDREERLPGMMHVFIFGAFVVLALRTVMLFVMGFSPTALEVLGDLERERLGRPPGAARPSTPPTSSSRTSRRRRRCWG